MFTVFVENHHCNRNDIKYAESLELHAGESLTSFKIKHMGFYCVMYYYIMSYCNYYVCLIILNLTIKASISTDIKGYHLNSSL